MRVLGAVVVVGVRVTGRVGEGGDKRGGRGKEKTRLPQHDLQIALSPWRLLSAPLFDPKWRRRGEGWGRARTGERRWKKGTLTKISPVSTN